MSIQLALSCEKFTKSTFSGEFKLVICYVFWLENDIFAIYQKKYVKSLIFSNSPDLKNCPNYVLYYFQPAISRSDDFLMKV